MVPGDAPNVGMNIELLKRPKGWTATSSDKSGCLSPKNPDQ